MTNSDILIIGAGPAGITAAFELDRTGKRVTVIEKESSVGGLAKTFEFREGDLVFRTDIGPHRFFSKNQYLYALIGDLLGDKWKLIPRKTRQYIEGKFYDYPINAGQAFRNIGLLKSGRIFTSYLAAVINYRILGKGTENFEDYIVSNFGRALGGMNMLNYTEKVWGIPCKEIHPDWAKQRIRGLNLISAVRNALQKNKKDAPKTLVDHFYYPVSGTGLVYETMAERIRKNGSVIHTKSYPVKIRHSRHRITEVDVLVDGKKRTMKPEILIESIPVTDFLNLLSPKPPREVMDAAGNLRWRNQVYMFITLDRDRVMDDNWMYFPDKSISFGRMAEMKNFSKAMSPEGKTSLFFEFFVFENDEIWDMPKDELLGLIVRHSERLGFFRREDVRNHYLIRKRNVYPVYDLNYQKNLDTIKKFLDNFSNLYYIGRPGRFKYNNQDHSMEMGIIAARSIIEGKRYDIDKTASEGEYFEKGQVKENLKEKRSYNWMILEDRGEYNNGKRNIN